MGLIAYGSSDYAVKEALDRTEEDGLNINYMRVRSFPFGPDVQQFLDAHDQVFVVEQNRDGQLRTLMLAELEVNKSKLLPVLHYDGMPITANIIVDGLHRHLATSTEQEAAE